MKGRRPATVGSKGAADQVETGRSGVGALDPTDTVVTGALSSSTVAGPSDGTSLAMGDPWTGASCAAVLGDGGWAGLRFAGAPGVYLGSATTNSTGNNAGGILGSAITNSTINIAGGFLGHHKICIGESF